MSNDGDRELSDAVDLFNAYMRITATPTLGPEPGGSGALRGKTLGVLNGSSWISLWSTYFGRLHLPGVKLVNVGNDAVQLSFMRAHTSAKPCPPPENVVRFTEYARDLVELFGVDAILITCSTMNRSVVSVRRAIEPYGVPVVQIDEPMMEAAVERGGKVLVVATHGPTVENTQALLQETADRLGETIAFSGATVEEAFDRLGAGDVIGHNDLIHNSIRAALSADRYTTVVLAQLSMSVFSISYPDAERTFGIPVLTSGQEGFRRARNVLERPP